MKKNNETSIIYTRLESLCKQRGIKITPLCLEISGSRGNLETWKKGNIRNDYLTKIAKYFDVSADYLLGLSETPEKAGLVLIDDERQLLDNYRSLNEEGQEKVVDYAGDLVASRKYIKTNSHGLLQKEA